jgi:hypothetical protein
LPRLTNILRAEIQATYGAAVSRRRCGDRPPAAPAWRGDRGRQDHLGEITPELKRETARNIELRSVNPAYPDRTIPRDEVSWMARILWASQ